MARRPVLGLLIPSSSRPAREAGTGSTGALQGGRGPSRKERSAPGDPVPAGTAGREGAAAR